MRENITLLMSPEDQLCLLLLRSELTAVERKQASELVSGPLQWPLLVNAPTRLTSLLCFTVASNSSASPDVPEVVRAELENFVSVNAIRNDLLARELARLLKLLSDAQIPAIPLKSTVLAETLYGDPALRVCADIDLLVPASNIRAAHNLIVSAGYTSHITQPFSLTCWSAMARTVS